MIPDTGPEIGPLTSDPFDALADLFLGELGRVAAHDVALGLVPSRSQQPARPEPARPSATHTLAQPPRLTLVAELDEPTDEGAGGAEAALIADHAAVPGPMIEALVLGHLPVLASAWAARYVRHAAEQQAAPVGLIRLAGGQARVELIAPPGSPAPAALPAAESLHDAWRLLLHACQRIVIHADAEHEAALIASPMVDEVTLLSAADEAAVVNAYRTLKTIAGRTAGVPGEPASLRVAVMGAPEPRARYVWSRLEEAAESFLGRPLRCAGLIGQIGPGTPGRVVFIGPCQANAAEVISHLTSVGPGRGAAAAVLREPQRVAERQPAPVLHAEAEDDEFYPDPAFNPAPAVTRRPAVRQAAPAATPAALPASLADLVPELTPIAARCPAAEDIELAVDSVGRLHALAAAGPHPESNVLARLTIAAGWAGVHRAVLQLTLGPGSRPLRPEPPAMHLFTDTPAAHRGLLDSPVRVHLLAAVAPRASAGWMAAALN